MTSSENSCRSVLQLASQEARRIDADRVGSEHLLVGILKEGGVGAAILATLGVDIRKIRDEAERLERSGEAEVIRARKRAFTVIHLGAEETWSAQATGQPETINYGETPESCIGFAVAEAAELLP